MKTGPGSFAISEVFFLTIMLSSVSLYQFYFGFSRFLTQMNGMDKSEFSNILMFKFFNAIAH
jgi:hypothetical protein